MRSISTLDKKLSNRDSRLLYCSIDSSITADIWNKMNGTILKDCPYQNDIGKRYDQVINLLHRMLGYTWNLRESVSKSDITSEIKVRQSQVTFDENYKKVLVQKRLIKIGESFDIKKLKRGAHQDKKVENRQLFKLLLNDIKLKQEIQLLRQLQTTQVSLYPNFSRFEFLLRSNTEKINLDDISLMSGLIPKSKIVCFENQLKNELGLETDDDLAMMWLIGDGPIVASRQCNMKTSEIKQKYTEYEEKYKDFTTKIDEIYLGCYETGWVKSPWTGSIFKCSHEINEKDLKNVLVNDITIGLMIKYLESLGEDQSFLIHKKKILHVS